MPKSKGKVFSHNQHPDRLEINEPQNTAGRGHSLTPALATTCSMMRTFKNSTCLKYILDFFFLIVTTAFCTLYFLGEGLFSGVLPTKKVCILQSTCKAGHAQLCLVLQPSYDTSRTSDSVLHVCPSTQSKTSSSTCRNNTPSGPSI